MPKRLTFVICASLLALLTAAPSASAAEDVFTAGQTARFEFQAGVSGPLGYRASFVVPKGLKATIVSDEAGPYSQYWQAGSKKWERSIGYFDTKLARTLSASLTKWGKSCNMAPGSGCKKSKVLGSGTGSNRNHLWLAKREDYVEFRNQKESIDYMMVCNQKLLRGGYWSCYQVPIPLLGYKSAAKFVKTVKLEKL